MLNKLTFDGKKIENISAYRDGYELMSDTDEGSRILAVLPVEEHEALKHADDYEAVLYILLNYDTVIIADSINGDIFEITTLKDFVINSAKWAYEEAHDEQI